MTDSMYPVDRLDVNQFMRLPESVQTKFWIDYTSMQWLPIDIGLKHDEWAHMQNQRIAGDPNSPATEAEIKAMGEVIGEIVVAWNVLTRTGEPIPQLKDDPNAWRQLPGAVVSELMRRASDGAKSGEIPTTNASPSSLGSTPTEQAAADRAEVTATELDRMTGKATAQEAPAEAIPASPAG